ncbi:MAG: hypothetical protein WBE34_11475, partial [Candidatus Nitrosopolaris sp.]
DISNCCFDFGYISFNRDDIEKKDDTIILEKIRNGSDQLKKRCTAEVSNNDRREHIKMLILPLSFCVSFYLYRRNVKAYFGKAHPLAIK